MSKKLGVDFTRFSYFLITFTPNYCSYYEP